MTKNFNICITVLKSVLKGWNGNPTYSYFRLKLNGELHQYIKMYNAR